MARTSPKILLADADDDFRQSFQSRLEEEGCRVITASTSADRAKIAREVIFSRKILNAIMESTGEYKEAPVIRELTSAPRAT